MTKFVVRGVNSCKESQPLVHFFLPITYIAITSLSLKRDDVYHIKSVKFTYFQFFYIEAEVAPGMYVIAS